jgi:hypothetical protein
MPTYNVNNNLNQPTANNSYTDHNDTSNNESVNDNNGANHHENYEYIFSKYDNMVFNPLRYENNHSDEFDNYFQKLICKYMTPLQVKDDKLLGGDKFSILNINVRSLSKNFEKLKECITAIDHHFTVIGVSETHLKRSPNIYYNLHNYDLEYTNRTSRGKGGVALYISNSVQYKVRGDLNVSSPNYESCFVEIERNNQNNLLIGVVYRAHNSIDHFTNEFNQLLSKINNENKTIYIMGDFNIDLLKEEEKRPIHNYLNMILSYYLLPAIIKPTRITELSATLIDNILTNNYDVSSVILVTDISDHLPNIISTNTIIRTKKTKGVFYKRNYTTANICHLKDNLSKVNWHELLHGNDVNNDYNNFMMKLNELIDECIPLRKCKADRRKEPMLPWITNGLLKSINTKNSLYRLYKKSPTDDHFCKYKKYRNKLHNLIRKAKRQFYYSKFQKSKNNMKLTWSTINNVLGRSKCNRTQTQFKIENGDTVTDPHQISNDFNEYFVNIGPKLADEIGNEHKRFDQYLLKQFENNIFFTPILEQEIVKIIAKFDQNKSPGHDGICNSLVKKIADKICVPLVMIFNLSIVNGVVPKDLKLAKVVPIHKKDDTEKYLNYRPVSILPCFSKILERLIFNRCLSFINSFNILSNKQFGFRPGHSTQMALIDIIDKIHTAVDNNETSMAIFLDLSKAFDTINHNILLYKLEYYGIRGIALEWFKSYLSNRTQYVYYNSCKSNVKDIRSGVPQGSILGPLLFILYVNDIGTTSSLLNFTMYADDTTLLYSDHDLATKIPTINNELQEVSKWFKANKLSINAAKTNYMIMGTPQKTFKFKCKTHIELDGIRLCRVTSTKFLGVIVDENLSFKFHIEAISNTISRNIGILNKLKHFFPKNILLCVYCSLVQSYLTYGILVWGNTHNIYLDNLLKMQKRAVRYITMSHYRAHSSPLFKDLKLLTIYDLYKFHIGLFMFKYSLDRLPSIFNQYFIKRQDVHNRITRSEIVASSILIKVKLIFLPKVLDRQAHGSGIHSLLKLIALILSNHLSLH